MELLWSAKDLIDLFKLHASPSLQLSQWILSQLSRATLDLHWFWPVHSYQIETCIIMSNICIQVRAIRWNHEQLKANIMFFSWWSSLTPRIIPIQSRSREAQPSFLPFSLQRQLQKTQLCNRLGSSTSLAGSFREFPRLYASVRQTD